MEAELSRGNTPEIITLTSGLYRWMSLAAFNKASAISAGWLKSVLLVPQCTTTNLV